MKHIAGGILDFLKNTAEKLPPNYKEKIENNAQFYDYIQEMIKEAAASKSS